MTWYLGRTTSGQVFLPEIGVKMRGEFAVERQLRRFGIEAWAPRRVEFKRVGKRRFEDAFEVPYLPGYVFANIPADRFYQASWLPGMWGDFMAITEKEYEREIEPFRRGVLEEYDEAQKIIRRQDRAAMCRYKAGDAIKLLSGPFKDRIVTFSELLPSQDMPRIRFVMDIMGREVVGEADPLDVAGVG